MPTGRKKQKQRSDDYELSFGSGLDEVDCKPRSGSFQLKPRVNKAAEHLRQNHDNALSALVSERRFSGADRVSTDSEVLEKATKAVKQARE